MRLEYKTTGNSGGAGVVIMFLGVMTIVLCSMGAWATHVVWIIKVLASDKGATLGQIVLGAVGTFFPPVGVVHGVMIWMGAS